MSDRDKPNYNPESSGDINDYWESSAAYQKHLADREASFGPITNKREWVQLFAKAVLEEDDFLYEKLREKATAWGKSDTHRQMMLSLLRLTNDLRTAN